MKRVLFVSPLFSPFHVEVGEALRRLGHIDYRIAFGMTHREGRQQPHWVRYEYDRERYASTPDGMTACDFYIKTIRDWDPDVVLSGQVVGDLLRAIVSTYDVGYALALWMEPPDDTRPAYYRAAARAAMTSRLVLADAILAIGDRAERYYRACAPRARVELVPYGEDLSECFEAAPSEKEDVFTFVFSGQLRANHNLDVIMAATDRIARRFGREARLVLAGYGPEQTTVDRALQASSALRGCVEYDRDYELWRDRLRPFRYGHALVYPCSYTGWGLVIPEAMAARCVPITTRRAEAARFFVRHTINGLWTRVDERDLTRQMAWCIEHQDVWSEMADRAQADARDGDAPAIALRLERALLACDAPVRRRPVQRTLARALKASLG